MKVVLCTIIVVTTSNLIRKIPLNMLCSVPCCEVHNFFFFFLALHGNAFSYHNFEIERSQYCKWYVPRTPNSSFYFPKASCNCWKRFSAYTFPRFIFNLRTLSYHSLSLDSERLHCSNGYVIRIRCKHWTWRGCISLCLVVVCCVLTNNCCSCRHILQRFGCMCKIFRSSCTFAGWALTEGQHRPKAGKKKKTREAGFLFWLSVGGSTTAGFEPARASPMDFKSISLTTRTHCLYKFSIWTPRRCGHLLFLHLVQP